MHLYKAYRKSLLVKEQAIADICEITIKILCGKEDRVKGLWGFSYQIEKYNRKIDIILYD